MGKACGRRRLFQRTILLIFLIVQWPVHSRSESLPLRRIEALRRHFADSKDRIKELANFVKANRKYPSVRELALILGIPHAELTRTFKEDGGPKDVRDVVEYSLSTNPQTRNALHRQFLLWAAQFTQRNFRPPTVQDISEGFGVAPDQLETICNPPKDLLGKLNEYFPNYIDRARTRMAKTYATTAKRLGRTPSSDEFASELNLSPERLSEVFGKNRLFQDLAALKLLAQEIQPAAFKSVIDTDEFDAERTKRMMQAIEARSRLILTTAVAGSPVNVEFLEALKAYAKANDAEIIVFPANMTTNDLDPKLLNEAKVHILTNSVHLSESLALNRVKLIAKQINPLTGLRRIGIRGQTQVVGSPKMHVETVPTIHNGHLPHQLVSTGAITNPEYAGNLYIQGRTDEIAAHDHVLGALILERNTSDESKNGEFHYRHVEFIPEKKGFVDLGKFYSADGTYEVRPEAIVLGDIHVGDTDPRVLESALKEIERLHPVRVVIHDLFNGHSVNHHEEGKVVTLAQRAKEGRLDLRKEISDATEFLNSLTRLHRDMEVVIVPSNHDFWLHRWLEAGAFMSQPHNTEIGLELARIYTEGKDPLKAAIEKAGLESADRIRFLAIGEFLSVGSKGREVELSLHGDAGANGGKGHLEVFQQGVDRSVVGHTHTVRRRNGVVNVGTLTNLILPYNKKGLSSWVQSMAIVGPNGEIQVLQFLRNQFYAASKSLRGDFFSSGFPKLISNNIPKGGGNIDQYGGESPPAAGTKLYSVVAGVPLDPDFFRTHFPQLYTQGRFKRFEDMGVHPSAASFLRSYRNVFAGQLGSALVWGMVDRDSSAFQRVVRETFTWKNLAHFSFFTGAYVGQQRLLDIAIPEEFILSKYFARHGLALAGAMWLTGFAEQAVQSGQFSDAVRNATTERALLQTAVATAGFTAARIPITALRGLNEVRKIRRFQTGLSTLNKFRRVLKLGEMAAGSAGALAAMAEEVLVFSAAAGAERLVLPLIDREKAKEELGLAMTALRREIDDIGEPLRNAQLARGNFTLNERPNHISKAAERLWRAVDQFDQAVILRDFHMKHIQSVQEREQFADAEMLARRMAVDPSVEREVLAIFNDTQKRFLSQEEHKVAQLALSRLQSSRYAATSPDHECDHPSLERSSILIVGTDKHAAPQRVSTLSTQQKMLNAMICKSAADLERMDKRTFLEGRRNAVPAYGLDSTAVSQSLVRFEDALKEDRYPLPKTLYESLLFKRALFEDFFVQAVLHYQSGTPPDAASAETVRLLGEYIRATEEQLVALQDVYRAYTATTEIESNDLYDSELALR